MDGHCQCPSVSTAVPLIIIAAHRRPRRYSLSSNAHPSAPFQRCSEPNMALRNVRFAGGAEDIESAATKSTSRTQHTAVDTRPRKRGSAAILPSCVVWAVVASCVTGSAQLPLCPSGWTYYYDSSGVEGHDSCVWLSSTTAVWAQANSTCRYYSLSTDLAIRTTALWNAVPRCCFPG